MDDSIHITLAYQGREETFEITPLEADCFIDGERNPRHGLETMRLSMNVRDRLADALLRMAKEKSDDDPR